jgi:hypothetical protein
VDTTQSQIKEKKVHEVEQKKDEKKKSVEDASFNPTRFTGNVIQTAKNVSFWVGLIILGLWGGSMASNHAIDKPFSIRFYYFIFGTLLFHVPFLFAFWRSDYWRIEARKIPWDSCSSLPNSNLLVDSRLPFHVYLQTSDSASTYHLYCQSHPSTRE